MIKNYEEMIIHNFFSFVFILIPFIIEISSDYNFTGNKFLKLILNYNLFNIKWDFPIQYLFTWS